MYCKTGLPDLIAKDEDEYVQLALKLASNIPALSNLRMGLRDVMSKSPICDGQNFILGLESTYRNMWHRYCKGDVPSLKRIEMIQREMISDDEPNAKLSDPTKITTPSNSALEPVKSNGFNPPSQPLTKNPSISEGNVVQFSQTPNTSKPG